MKQETEPSPGYKSSPNWDIIHSMTGIAGNNESHASILCKACGLCCTGHLFIWAKLRPAELDPAEAMGMHVFRSDPSQRGFSQPCPLWRGQCTIYASLHYPHICRAYKCKLLKDVLAGNTALPNALGIIEQAKGMIHELAEALSIPPGSNFREHLVVYLETREKATGQEHIVQKAGELLSFYENVFGVNDLLEKPAEK